MNRSYNENEIKEHDDYIIGNLYMNHIDNIKENNKNSELKDLEQKFNEFDPNLRVYTNDEYLWKKKEIEDKYRKSSANRGKRINIKPGTGSSNSHVNSNKHYKYKNNSNTKKK